MTSEQPFAAVLSVGEPWDFQTPAGTNELAGVVEPASNGDSDARRFRLAEPLQIDGRIYGTELVVTARYLGDHVTSLAPGSAVVVNASIETPDGRRLLLIGTLTASGIT